MRSGRVVLVGEVNPYGLDTTFALWPAPSNSAGARLRDILGLRTTTYVKLTRVNLCSRSWLLREARTSFAKLMEARSRLPEPSVIVLLGNKVADAADLRRIPTFDSDSVEFAGRAHDIIRLPHPSGRCQTWNDPTSRTKARILLTHLAPEIQWGEATPD